MNQLKYLIVSLGFLLIPDLGQSQVLGVPVMHWRMDERTGHVLADWAVTPPLNEFGANFGQLMKPETPGWRSAAGISRGALYFDGNTAVEQQGYAGAARSLAVSLWIRPDAFQNTTLVHKMDDGDTGKGWQLALKTDGSVEFQIGSWHNHSVVSVADGYTPGKWVLVTAVYEGPGKKEKLRSRATLFIDGAVAAVGCDLPQTAGGAKGRLRAGIPFHPVTATIPPGPGYSGEMDRMLLWAGELKRAEVAKLADFNDPTTIRVARREPGNSVEWVLTAEDPDFEDDFDFELLPPTDGSEPHPVRIRGNLLIFSSLPPAGGSWLLTIRANDGTGRGVVRTFRFDTPPGTTPDNGGGGDDGGGSEGDDDGCGGYGCGGYDCGDGDGDGDGDGGGGGGGEGEGEADGSIVILPPVWIPPFVTSPQLTRQWSPDYTVAGTMTGSLRSSIYHLDKVPAPVWDIRLVAGAGDSDNALFRIRQEAHPADADAVLLEAAAPLDFHDGRVFSIRLQAVTSEASSLPVVITFSAARLHLNEFLADNEYGRADNDGDTSDWIEVRNDGLLPLRLDGWCLSNDPGFPDQWQAPSIVLGGGDFYVFSASKKGGTPSAIPSSPRPDHTNFTLKKEEGEYLGLFAPDGQSMISEYVFLPAQKADDSYGCHDDNPGTRGFLASVTPGEPNGPAAIPRLEDVTVEPGHGVYGQDVRVVLRCATPGARIFYTLDGSWPTPEKAILYTAPLVLTDSTALRARAWPASASPSAALPSNPLTASYILTHAILRQPAMQHVKLQPVEMALRSLPVLALTMEPKVLSGLLPGGTGEAGAADTDLEWLPAPGTPAGSLTFQATAGIRVAGQSRVTVTPKAAFRLNFADWLKAPLLGPGRAAQFKELALRNSFQNSWLSGDAPERSRGQEIRDEFVRRLHSRMGWLSPEGTFVHLFLNGQYYGLFNPTEVPGDVWQFSYSGCSDDDFDTLKEGEVTDDESKKATVDWAAINAFIREQPVTDPDYLNTIGAAVDLDSLIDMILLRAYVGDAGFLFWSGGGMKFQRNWYAGREWVNHKPFEFFAWDAERTMENVDFNAFTADNKSTLFEKLIALEDFRARVIARVQRHFYDAEGAFAGDTPKQLYSSLAAQVEAAIPAEAARWGDKNAAGALYTLADWRKERDRLLNTWFPARREVMLAQLTALGLNVTLTKPVLSLSAGWHPEGSMLTVSADPGTVIYFTGEGESADPVGDPRSAGGSVSLQAQVWTGSLTLNVNTILTFRAWKTGVWSPPERVVYHIGPQRPSRSNLVVSEILFRGPEAGKGNFIEFHNPSPEPIDVAGLLLAGGVRFNGGTTPRVLEAGGYALIVEDTNRFSDLYGTGLPVWGQWSGALDTDHEEVMLTIPQSEFAGGRAFDYSIDYGWPREPLVKACSIVARESSHWIEAGEPEAWRSSYYSPGSPGAEDLPIVPAPPLVLVNEVLKAGPVTKVELWNSGSGPADVSGWILAAPDQALTPQARSVLPPGTVIAAGGYAVVETASDYFTSAPALELTAANAAGKRTGYVDALTLYPMAEGVSQGRITAGDGNVVTAPLAAPTMGSANLWPRVPQVVISEIMYHPLEEEQSSPRRPVLDWIELHNRSTVPADLSGMLLLGVAGLRSDILAQSGSLPADGRILVVGGRAAGTFRVLWRVPAEVPIVEAADMEMENSGPFVKLGGQNPDGSNFHYTEWVRTDDRAPWPDSADGEGRSLERVLSANFADDASVWRASYQNGGSPGQSRAASYASWVKANFSTNDLLDLAIINPGADRDGDRLNNLGEYAFGGRPGYRDPPTALTLSTTPGTAAGGLSVTFIRRVPGLSSAAYTVEVSNSLTTWRDVSTRCDVTNREARPNGLEEVTLHYAGPETVVPACFLRVSARLTLP